MNPLNRRLPWEARRILYDRLGFEPLEKQRAALADVSVPFIAFAGGVGAGKSLTAAKYLLPEVVPDYLKAVLLQAAGIPVEYRGELSRRFYWLAGPDYTLCRREFDLLCQDLHKLGVEMDGPNQPQEGPWWLRIRDTGTEVETKSASQPDSFHSKPIQGILACEAALISPWVRTERLIPRITRGVADGWMFASGTFEGVENWMVQAFEEGQEAGSSWHSYSMASWDNTVDHPDLTDDMHAWLEWYVRTMPSAKVMAQEENRAALRKLRKQAQDIYHALTNMPVDSFAQRFGAIPQKPTGLVYPEFDERVHVDPGIVFDPSRPVQVWIDPGVENPYAVLAVQLVEEEGQAPKVQVIDEVYYRHCTTEEMIGACVERPWWDAVTGGVIDATQLEQKAVWQRGDVWNRLRKTAPYLKSQKVLVETGIERTRLFLRNPATNEANITFSPKCVSTISEFGKYRWPSFKAGEMTVRKAPEDKNNHSIKAIAYGLVSCFGIGTHFEQLDTRQLAYRPRFPTR